MDLLILIVWLLLGIILFGIVNKCFNILYFGFSGMLSVFVGCMAAVAIGFYFIANIIGGAVGWTISFFTAHYRWIIGVGLVLVFLANRGNKTTKKEETNESNQANNQN